MAVYTINARQYGQYAEPDLSIRIRTDLPLGDITRAVKDAVTDFLENGGNGADTALSATGGNFNWGDMALWLPESYAKAHGFEVLGASPVDLVVAHDQSLLP